MLVSRVRVEHVRAHPAPYFFGSQPLSDSSAFFRNE